MSIKILPPEISIDDFLLELDAAVDDCNREEIVRLSSIAFDQRNLKLQAVCKAADNMAKAVLRGSRVDAEKYFHVGIGLIRQLVASAQ